MSSGTLVGLGALTLSYCLNKGLCYLPPVDNKLPLSYLVVGGCVLVVQDDNPSDNSLD